MSRKKNQLRMGVLLNYLNIGLGNLIPIFYTPVMLTLLGQNEYGLYKLAGSVTSYLSLASLGLGSAISRYLIKSREEGGKEAEEGILGLFTLIFQGIAIATFLIGISVVFSLQIWYGESLAADELSRMRVLVFLMVINTALGFSMTPYLSAVSAHEEFIFTQSMNILSSCLVPLLNIVTLRLGFGSIALVICSLAFGVVMRCVYYLYVRKVLGLKARYEKRTAALLKEILGFSLWIFVADVVGQLYNATDIVLIGAVPVLATSGVAVYNVGAMFNSIVFNLTIGVSALLSPKINRLVFSGATDEELTDLAIRVGRIQGFIFSLVVTGFIVFGKPFIRFYVGPDYTDAYWVALFMMIPNMIPLVQSICLNVVIAQNKHRFRSLTYLGIAVLNVAGTWILIRHMGIVGAALMTGIALVIGQGFAMNWYYWKNTGLNMVRFWRQVCKVYVVPVIMCIGMLLVSKVIDFYRIPALLLGISVYAVMYCACSWFFVMNPYEKGLIRSLFVKPT